MPERFQQLNEEERDLVLEAARIALINESTYNWLADELDVSDTLLQRLTDKLCSIMEERD